MSTLTKSGNSGKFPGNFREISGNFGKFRKFRVNLMFSRVILLKFELKIQQNLDKNLSKFPGISGVCGPNFRVRGVRAPGGVPGRFWVLKPIFWPILPGGARTPNFPKFPKFGNFRKFEKCKFRVSAATFFRVCVQNFRESL